MYKILALLLSFIDSFFSKLVVNLFNFDIDVSEEEIPLHYSAPESILDDRFDYKTDTWMLGLVIHGIFTHGAFPYTPSGFHLEKVLEYVCLCLNFILCI